jgi:hypothetical protein
MLITALCLDSVRLEFLYSVDHFYFRRGNEKVRISACRIGSEPDEGDRQRFGGHFHPKKKENYLSRPSSIYAKDEEAKQRSF